MPRFIQVHLFHKLYSIVRLRILLSLRIVLIFPFRNLFFFRMCNSMQKSEPLCSPLNDDDNNIQNSNPNRPRFTQFHARISNWSRVRRFGRARSRYLVGGAVGSMDGTWASRRRRRHEAHRWSPCSLAVFRVGYRGSSSAWRFFEVHDRPTESIHRLRCRRHCRFRRPIVVTPRIAPGTTPLPASRPPYPRRPPPTGPP